MLGVVGSSPGQPYSEFGVTTDRDNILALYFNEGFPEASFTSTADRVTAQAGPTGKTETKPGDFENEKSQKKEKEEEKEKKSRPEAAQAAPVRLVYHIAGRSANESAANSAQRLRKERKG